jgi:hypothetical protein
MREEKGKKKSTRRRLEVQTKQSEKDEWMGLNWMGWMSSGRKKREMLQSHVCGDAMPCHENCI